MNFVAIDVETANARMASICQVGLARIENGCIVNEWATLVDPEDFFDGLNVSIHGISEETVQGSPTLPKIADALRSHLEGSVVVCHSHFDRVALHQAFSKYQLPALDATWLDSARVARRTWKECASSGYGLHNVCAMLGYEFRHHDALEDAKAAAHILLSASKVTGLDLEGWGKRVGQPIDPAVGTVVREGNPEGPLHGEVIVFTGALEIPRREAADMAAAVGCQVSDGVNKRTTMLVVGDQDITKLAGFAKSSKHRKAEDLAMKGQPIRILRETDFKQLVKMSNA